jgi:hypothetical protein
MVLAVSVLVLGLSAARSPIASAQGGCGMDVDCQYPPFAALQRTISDNVGAPFRDALLHEVAVAEGLYRRNNFCGSVRMLTAMDHEVAGLANRSQIATETAELIHAGIGNVITIIFPPDPVVPGDACRPEGPPI